MRCVVVCIFSIFVFLLAAPRRLLGASWPSFWVPGRLLAAPGRLLAAPWPPLGRFLAVLLAPWPSLGRPWSLPGRLLTALLAPWPPPDSPKPSLLVSSLYKHIYSFILWIYIFISFDTRRGTIPISMFRQAFAKIN